MDDNCILELCDPDGLPLSQAIRLARDVSHVEPNLASTLGAYVCHLADSPESEPKSMQRALAVFYSVADPHCFAATCRHVEEEGNPVAQAMVRWLQAGTPRRLARMRIALPMRSRPLRPGARI